MSELTDAVSCRCTCTPDSPSLRRMKFKLREAEIQLQAWQKETNLLKEEYDILMHEGCRAYFEKKKERKTAAFDSFILTNESGEAASYSKDASVSAESNSSGNITPGLRNHTTPPHPVVSPHRPAPSPSGFSTGSPSMSPALGHQPNIPMPPRPSSNQSKNSGQVQMTQPPMTAQGYNQQMAPPSAMYGKEIHQNRMGGSSSHMPPYSSQSSGHYPQSGYHQPPGTMHSYGNQSQNSYLGPSYPGQSSSGGPHRMPSHPSSAPSNFSSPSAGSNYNSSQYPGGDPSSGFGMNNMMPPPNQYPKSATMPPPAGAAGGAQAAAQDAVIAAIIAAAASSTGIPQSPMYLRQHLQQKIYANNYNSTIGPGAPGSNGGQETPMAPPASTPSLQPMSMNQSSMPPSSVSLGNASSCDGPVSASMFPAGFTQTSAPSSLGISSTTITQSISSPVPSAVTVSSPSIPDMMQSQQVRNTSRYDQNTPQSPMIRPNNPSSSVIGPSPQPDSSYPSHRYPSPSMAGRENISPQPMGSYQGRPMEHSHYPGPNSQTSGQSPYPPSQPDSYRNTELKAVNKAERYDNQPTSEDSGRNEVEARGFPSKTIADKVFETVKCRVDACYVDREEILKESDEHLILIDKEHDRLMELKKELAKLKQKVFHP